MKTADDRPGAGGPPDLRPGNVARTGPLFVEPGDTRYERAGGLRARLAAATQDDEDVHVVIDLAELRRRTVR